MFVLISYDIATQDAEGKRRLRRVSKLCTDWAQRVQFSVFECSLDYGQWLKLRAALLTEIDAEKDSIRFYMLGNNWRGKVEHIGAKPSYDPEGLLLL